MKVVCDIGPGMFAMLQHETGKQECVIDDVVNEALYLYFGLKSQAKFGYSEVLVRNECGQIQVMRKW